MSRAQFCVARRRLRRPARGPHRQGGAPDACDAGRCVRRAAQVGRRQLLACAGLRTVRDLVVLFLLLLLLLQLWLGQVVAGKLLLLLVVVRS